MADDPVEVDRDYLWALEVIACHSLGDRSDQNPDDVEAAHRAVDNAVLRQPRRR